MSRPGEHEQAGSQRELAASSSESAQPSAFVREAVKNISLKNARSEVQKDFERLRRFIK